MKKIYLYSLFIFTLPGCSKDFLKHYDDRIVGSWYISDVYRFGIGGNFEELAYRNGSFTFHSDGTLSYIDESGNISEGTWDIQKRKVDGEVIRTFHVTSTDFNNQLVRSEFYDDMQFRSTNHFVAKINTRMRSFVTHFRR